jgi:hypothetical protein
MNGTQGRTILSTSISETENNKVIIKTFTNTIYYALKFFVSEKKHDL